MYNLPLSYQGSMEGLKAGKLPRGLDHAHAMSAEMGDRLCGGELGHEQRRQKGAGATDAGAAVDEQGPPQG